MPEYLSRLHRVYLVDDHDIVRRGVRDLLVPARDIAVVGDCGSVREAVPAILRLEPDVVLLDLNLQDGTGIEICRAVRSVNPSICGLLLTAAGDDQATAAAVLAGAAGYLVKLSRNSDILGAIRKLHPGATSIDEESAERAARHLRSIVDSLTPSLTEPERRAVELVLEGRTDSQVTAALAAQGSRLDRDVAEMVARVSGVLLGHERRPGDPSAGKHRRTD